MNPMDFQPYLGPFALTVGLLLTVVVLWRLLQNKDATERADLQTQITILRKDHEKCTEIQTQMAVEIKGLIAESNFVKGQMKVWETVSSQQSKPKI